MALCSYTAVALKRHERVNAFNLVWCIVVINVKKNIKKTLKTRFNPKNKKNVCKRDKTLPSFLLAFDIGPIN